MASRRHCSSATTPSRSTTRRAACRIPPPRMQSATHTIRPTPRRPGSAFVRRVAHDRPSATVPMFDQRARFSEPTRHAPRGRHAVDRIRGSTMLGAGRVRARHDAARPCRSTARRACASRCRRAASCCSRKADRGAPRGRHARQRRRARFRAPFFGLGDHRPLLPFQRSTSGTRPTDCHTERARHTRNARQVPVAHRARLLRPRQAVPVFVERRFGLTVDGESDGLAPARRDARHAPQRARTKDLSSARPSTPSRFRTRRTPWSVPALVLACPPPRTTRSRCTRPPKASEESRFRSCNRPRASTCSPATRARPRRARPARTRRRAQARTLSAARDQRKSDARDTPSPRVPRSAHIARSGTLLRTRAGVLLGGLG